VNYSVTFAIGYPGNRQWELTGHVTDDVTCP